MAKEIERKFLVRGKWHRPDDSPYDIKQGYLNTDPDRTVRVRVEYDGYRERCWLTVKGRNRGAVRDEYEMNIEEPSIAVEMLDNLCQGVIHKTRTVQHHAPVFWEIDEFHGENEGLIIAEVELASEDQMVELPEWVGEEVTHDPRYFNSNLSINPYKNWRP